MPARAILQVTALLCSVSTPSYSPLLPSPPPLKEPTKPTRSQHYLQLLVLELALQLLRLGDLADGLVEVVLVDCVAVVADGEEAAGDFC